MFITERRFNLFIKYFIVFSILSILTLVFFKAYKDTSASSNHSSYNKISLEGDFSILKINRNTNLDKIDIASLKIWKHINISKNNNYKEKTKGRYLLKKNFSVDKEFEYPSIILGLLGDKHRVYLNGYFIGGSDYFSTISTYPFDKKLLSKDKTNTLLIDIHAYQSNKLNFTFLNKMGAYVGEFSQTSSDSLNDLLSHHFLKFLYAIIALILFGICFFYYLSNPRQKEFFYFTIYLLLGTLYLIYHNFFISQSIEFQLFRFLKVFSLTVSSMIIFSAALSLANKKKLELFNNTLILTLICILIVSLLFEPLTSKTYFFRYNIAFLIVLLHNIAFFVLTIYFTYATYQKFNKRLKSLEPEAYLKNFLETDEISKLSSHRYLGVILLASICNILANYESVQGKYDPFNLDPTVLLRFDQLGAAFPFIFSFIMIIVIIYQHITQGHLIKYSQEKNKLILKIISLMSTSKDLKSCTSIIQRQICDFINSTRSTIYICKNIEEHEFLEAEYIYGSEDKITLVKKKIEINEGIIGKVFKSQKPLLITDIDKDKKHFSLFNEKKYKNYSTRSCMIFPLVVLDKTIGVLTISDKANQGPFDKKDFLIVLEAARDFAFMINSASLQDKLNQQLDGVILSLSRMIGRKDPYTIFHSDGVMFTLSLLAAEMQIDCPSEMKISALLHDIGKIFVPRRILNKPLALNEKEIEIIKKHSQWSSEVLSEIPGFERIAIISGHHHERIDGSGYPQALDEAQIPFESKLISLADVIDALATHRAYRSRYSYSKIEKILCKMRENKEFPINMIEAAIKVIKSDTFQEKYDQRKELYQPPANRDTIIFRFYRDQIKELKENIEEFSEYLKKEPENVKPEIMFSAIEESKLLIEKLGTLLANIDKKQ
ncbi:MAG: HD domain-containing phosphohydrolase [Pseudomonadota bacterium]